MTFLPLYLQYELRTFKLTLTLTLTPTHSEYEGAEGKSGHTE